MDMQQTRNLPQDKVLRLDPDNPPPGWTPEQVRSVTDTLTEQLALAGELPIPGDVRNSPAFRAALGFRVVFCIACTGWLIYAIVAGRFWLDLVSASVAVAWSWLITWSAFQGKVLKKRDIPGM
jgi:hypothetical protein